MYLNESKGFSFSSLQRISIRTVLTSTTLKCTKFQTKFMNSTKLRNVFLKKDSYKNQKIFFGPIQKYEFLIMLFQNFYSRTFAYVYT